MTWMLLVGGVGTWLGCTVGELTTVVDRLVAAVSVSPATADVAVGESIGLAASAVDDVGAPIPGVTFTWRSLNTSVASVNGSGQVSGVGEGETEIIAQSGEFADTATVTVVESGTEPPPPPPPGGDFTNEPAGMTLVTNTDFSSLTGGGWTYGPKWGTARIVSDATAPYSPSSVLQFDYPAGFTAAGESPAAMRPPSIGANRHELFWGFYWKANPEWQSHSSNINKILFGWINGSTTFGLTWHNASINVGGRQVGPTLALFEGGDYHLFNTSQAQDIEPGTWYKIEFYFRPSSGSGTADGEFRLWVNGVLYSNHQNIVTPSGTITEVYYDPTWGGVGGSPKAHDDWFRIDQTRISVR
jgi:hypothetical protein